MILRKSSHAAVLTLLLAAASPAQNPVQPAAPPKPDDPETVLATFHVKPGQLPAFLQLMADYGKALHTQNLVTLQPYILMQGDEDGKPVVVQLFTWRSHDIPDHIPADIKPYWNKMNTMVEARNGRPGIDFIEVTSVP